MRLKDCLEKAVRIDRHVKRAMVGNAKRYIKEGLSEKEASLRAVTEFRSVVQDNLARVNEAINAPAPAAVQEAPPQQVEAETLPPAPEAAQAAPEPKAEPSNEETLQSSGTIKVAAPKGATFIRATDDKGRASEEPIKDANKGLNIFQGAGPWVKVEAGTRDAKGNFVPMDGEVTIQDRAFSKNCCKEARNSHDACLHGSVFARHPFHIRSFVY